MARKKVEKMDVGSLKPLGHNPFAGLGDRLGMQGDASAKAPEAQKEDAPLPSPGDHPILLIRKEKRKKGKWVTCIYHLTGSVDDLAKQLRQKLGTGGTVDEGVVVLQGDHRERAAELMRERGYRLRLD